MSEAIYEAECLHFPEQKVRGSLILVDGCQPCIDTGHEIFTVLAVTLREILEGKDGAE